MPKMSDSYYDGDLYEQICWYCNGHGERYEGSRCPICRGSGILEYDEEGRAWDDSRDDWFPGDDDFFDEYDYENKKDYGDDY